MGAEEFAAALADFIESKTDTAFVVAVRLADAGVTDAEKLVTSAEREEAARLRRDDDRRRFVIGRAALRCLLARICAENPADLVFTRNAFGKPEMAGVAHFNLSHSGGIVLIAMHATRPIGIDVEALPGPADWPDLAKDHLAEAERTAIFACSEADRPTAFLRAWTRKEAVAKAAGLGLSLPFASFSVDAVAGRWQAVAETGGAQKHCYACCDLDLDADHVGAVAVAGGTAACRAAAIPFDVLLSLHVAQPPSRCV
jgi:4'-phosphopantetheinyl transferase